MQFVVVFIFSISSLLTFANGNGFVSMKFIKYWNRYGHDKWLSYCDSGLFGGRTSHCDLVFRLTLDGRVDGSGPYWGTVESQTFHNQDTVYFGGVFGGTTPNPVHRTFYQWKGRLIIKIHIFDRDSLTGHDAVDDLDVTIHVTPDGLTRTYLLRGYYHYSDSFLQFTLRVCCDTNWYTSSCTKYCKPTNDASGHYSCTSTGDKICLAGWIDVGDNCRKRDLCYGVTCLNRGYCNRDDGSCTCPPQYHGSKCENRRKPCEMDDRCKNGGRCINVGWSGTRCECPSGWKGTFCETDRNECTEGRPCKNGATCVNTRGSYSCKCTSGFMGTHCTTNIDECKGGTATICLNGGRCEDLHGSYKCHCKTGYTGVHCESDVDECSVPTACNNGTCKNTFGSFTCTCFKGFKGTTCNEDINECETTANICKNNGTCINRHGSYQCACQIGFTGKNCDADINECHGLLFCINNGTCVNTFGGAYCRCPPTFYGDFCHLDVNECRKNASLCRPNGICVNIDGGFKCNCSSGFAGRSCEISIDECSRNSSLCINKGTCINVWGGYECECPFQFTGRHCEEDFDECSVAALNKTGMQYCENGGTCVNTFGGAYCRCPKTFEGAHCQSDANECLRNTSLCANNGTCVNIKGGFECNCSSGYHGALCETDVDECGRNSSLCANNGTCVNVEGGYRCDCQEGFRGDHCKDDVYECSNDTFCGHHGTCINTYGSASCLCSDHFEGHHCEKDIDECLRNRSLCANNGTCTNEWGGYNCSCKTGFDGHHCEKDINECLRGPCKNSGTCVNEHGGYKCSCTAGFEGRHCENDENECVLGSLFCLNDGTCVNTKGSAYCACTEYFDGPHCEYRLPQQTVLPFTSNRNAIKAGFQPAMSVIPIFALIIVVIAVVIYFQRNRIQPFLHDLMFSKTSTEKSPRSSFHANGDNDQVSFDFPGGSDGNQPEQYGNIIYSVSGGLEPIDREAMFAQNVSNALYAQSNKGFVNETDTDAADDIYAVIDPWGRNNEPEELTIKEEDEDGYSTLPVCTTDISLEEPSAPPALPPRNLELSAEHFGVDLEPTATNSSSQA